MEARAMTADVELLPLPECGTGVYVRAEVESYARTCVAHVTAAKDAEIEALRAEVTEARDGWHTANGTADLAMKHRDEAEAHAERLAEALRFARTRFAPHMDDSDCAAFDAALNPTAAQENDDA